MHSAIRIGLIGDYSDQQQAHQAIPRSLAASGAEGVWVPTESVNGPKMLSEFDGIWCVPGMPYRNPEGALRAIRHARMTRTPFLGTSAGFQYAILEFARNVLGLGEADHQKSNPKAAMPLISPLGCGLAGVKARVRFTEGSILRRAYGTRESTEEYRCSFGVNNRYRRLLEGGDLVVAAVDDQNEIRAVEFEGHPFFVATLFQPELRAHAEEQKNPIVHALVACCEKRREGMTRAAS
jgi:CTP synthase (UTP-ammonia lyase)